MMNNGLKPFDIISGAGKSFSISLGSFRQRFIDQERDLFMCVNEGLVDKYVIGRRRGFNTVNIFEYLEDRINVEKLEISKLECDVVIRILHGIDFEFDEVGFNVEQLIINRHFEASQNIEDFKYFGEYEGGHGILKAKTPSVTIEKWNYQTDRLMYARHHGNYLDFRKDMMCGAIRRVEVPKIRHQSL